MRRPFLYFLAALLTMFVGLLLAARHFPGGFDWAYTVVSALMSQKHNPVGSYWFAASLSLAMLLLWPYVSFLKRDLPDASRLIKFIRVGLLFGMLLGAERLFIHDLSHLLYKSHELIALLTFIGLYFGILGLLIKLSVQQPRLRLSMLLVAIPLIVVSVRLFWLYLLQRETGWVDASWREKGIPVWASFAYWQWWMIGFLWLGMGMLSRGKKR